MKTLVMIPLALASVGLVMLLGLAGWANGGQVMALEHGDFDPTAELDAYLRECVGINPEDIQTEFQRIPSDLAYWNAQYARAMRGFLHAKLDEKVLKANLEPIVREALREEGAKGTEAQVAAAVESHERYIEAQRRTIEAEVEKNEIFGKLDAIRSKKEMLISLGAHLRAEMEGDPLIREQARARKVMGG